MLAVYELGVADGMVLAGAGCGTLVPLLELDIIHSCLHYSPGNLTVAALEFGGRVGRERILRKKLDPVRAAYDFVLIDCPATLSLLTINARAAADLVLLPIQCELLSLYRLKHLLATISLIREEVNPGLTVAGFLLTMYDSRMRLPTTDMTTRVRLTKRPETYLRTRERHREFGYEVLLAAGCDHWRAGERVRCYRRLGGQPLWLPDETDDGAEDGAIGTAQPAGQPGTTRRNTMSRCWSPPMRHDSARLASQDWAQLVRLDSQLGLWDQPLEAIEPLWIRYGKGCRALRRSRRCVDAPARRQGH